MDVYMTELFAKVMLVMAGFKKKEDYYLPRLEVEMDWTEEEVTEFLFANIKVWRLQHQSARGDKTKAAHDFLFNVLPFLSGVLVQTGAYFICDFPNHDLSMRLRSLLPPSFERWAWDARAKAKELLQTWDHAHVMELNGATQAAFAELQRESLAKHREMKEEMKGLQQGQLVYSKAKLR